MKKDKFIEITPDGKTEIEEGKEPLNKPNQYPIDAAQSNYQDSLNEEERKKNMKKYDKEQIKIGTKIESEHKKTIEQIIKDAKSGKLKPLEHYYKGIAEDHLDEIKKYYTHLVNMENKFKKSLYNRWSLLKAKLKNEEAFMTMLSEDKDEDKDSQEDQEKDQQSSLHPDEVQNLLSGLKEGNESSDSEESQQPAPQQDQQDQQDPEQADTATEQTEDIPADVIQEAGGEQEAEKLSNEQIASMMEEMGYTSLEIAHVLHGHTIQKDPDEDRAEEAHRQEMEIKRHELETLKNSSQIDVDHTKNTKEEDLKRIGKLNDIEIDHEKKMKDLDYQMARRAREMELEYKQKELELKIRNADRDARAKREQKKEQSSSKDDNSKTHERRLVDNIVN